MALLTGSTLSSYKILGPLGAGAMGEVYRARDTKLGREVAIKVLPTHFADDEERLKRFEREAKTLASLNHPNVAQIFGVDQVGELCFLVLELVPGESLDERLKRGPLPIEEAIDVGRQIAEGLEAAHEAGVIHRDLKPANVRLTPDGKVKVLDFGLAKPASESGQGSSTDSVLTTEAGRLLGTPTYMAPEQARGKAIDRRVDIWAFGCVLYECLTARRAFAGETLGDVLASVLEREPDWTSLPPATPPHVRALLERCFAKDPRARLRDIGEARVALIGAHGSARAETRPPERFAATRLRTAAIALSIGFALGVGVGAALYRRAIPDGAGQRPVTRLSVAIPNTELMAPAVGVIALALSPDGRTLAYCAQRDGQILLFLRSLGENEARVVPGSQDAHNPFFSHDGQWVAFFAGEKLKKAPVRGGEPLDLCPSTGSRGACWLEDGSIVLAPTMAGGLYRLPASGGEPEPLTELDSGRNERTHRWPSALPGGEWVLFVVGTTDQVTNYERAVVCAVSLETKERREVFAGAGMAKYSPSGHLVFGRPGTLLAVSFDLATLEVRGSELPVVNGVASIPESGGVQFDLSRDGTLAYLPDVEGFHSRELVWVDRSGRIDPLNLPPQPYWYPRLSPDEKQILVSVGKVSVHCDLWLADIERAKLNRLTFDQRCAYPLWAPGGGEIAYVNSSDTFQLLLRSLEQSAVPRSILSREKRLVFQPTGFQADGSGVFFHYFGDPESDIHFVAAEGTAPPRALAEDASSQWGAVASPDGRWVAFVSNETGRDEIFVRSFSRPAAKWQASSDGGIQPMWSRDGKELFYVHEKKLVAMTVEAEGEDFLAGPTSELFTLPAVRGAQKQMVNYDVARDGKRFLTTRIADARAELENIDIVLGWPEELRRLLPAENE